MFVCHCIYWFFACPRYYLSWCSVHFSFWILNSVWLLVCYLLKISTFGLWGSWNVYDSLQAISDQESVYLWKWTELSLLQYSGVWKCVIILSEHSASSLKAYMTVLQIQSSALHLCVRADSDMVYSFSDLADFVIMFRPHWLLFKQSTTGLPGSDNILSGHTGVAE